MINSEFTAIDALPTNTIAVVKYGIHRRLKVLIIIIGSLIVITIIVSAILSYVLKSKSTDNYTKYRTIKTTIKTKIYISDSYLNVTGRLMSFGLLLNHSLYFDYSQMNPFNGSVIQVRFCLFNHWQGVHPLYIFVIRSFRSNQSHIVSRYSIIPDKNTTQWQIRDIPKGLLSIQANHHVAIGMQDPSDTNQIYAISNSIGMYGHNITNMSRYIVVKNMLEKLITIAFSYKIIENGDD